MNPRFIEYHEDLLKKCKLKNYNQRERKQLDDLEMLADLQHHQAATCLIDFTRSALVALWFACKKSDADGRVFVVNIADEATFLEITSADIEDESISDVLGFKTREKDKDQTDGLPTSGILAESPNRPSFWSWTPAHLNERITAQHSLFLFGLPSSRALKSEKLIIEKASKEQIRKELEALHNICEESLFPDFVGFADTQRCNAPYPIPDAEKYFLSGVKAIQQGQHSDALADFAKAIEINPNYVEAYHTRAAFYISQGEYNLALADSTKAIEINPDYAGAYYARGFIYGSQGKHDLSIADSTKAIEINPYHPGAYYNRACVRLHLEEWKEAKSDLTAAKDMGLDIVALFRQYTKSVANFEQRTGIELPEDIAEMLTENEN